MRRPGTTGRLARRACPRAAALALAASLLAPAALLAQDPARDSTLARCQGLLVSAVDIEPEPPRLPGKGAPRVWRAVSKVVLGERTTTPGVVRDFLRVEPGDRCDDRARFESARLLRAQPFIADAEVRAVSDGAGGVRLVVRTVDDLPLVVSGRLSGGGVTGMSYGNANVMGQGRLAVVSWEQGHAFRDGYGLRLADFHALGGPNRAALRLERAPLGHEIDASLMHPFHTPLQRNAWTTAYRTRESYDDYRRRGAETISLPSRREQWSAGGVVRIGGAGQSVFAGALAFGDRFERVGMPRVVTDSGLVDDGDTLLAERWGAASRTNVAAVVGLAALSYLRVEGFDALAGPQDVGRGVQLAVAADPGLGKGRYLAGDVYAGAGTQHWFVGGQMLLEGWRPEDESGWHDVVVGGRLAWYLKPAAKRTIITSAEYGGVWHPRLPYQVTLGDGRGGLHGYRDAEYAGGHRAILRGEYRRLVGGVPRLASLGVAGFAEGGKLWAGDAPYGVATGTKGSVGLALLAAVPPQSRRMLRVDVAYPLVQGGGAGWELRATATSALRGFWREPWDVQRLRSPALTSSIFDVP